MSITHSIVPQNDAPQIVLPVNDAGDVVVPEAGLLFGAEFTRSGHDLLLVNDGTPTLRVPDYFATQSPADIYSTDGAVLRGATVELLAGPLAPGQYAQAGGAVGAGPIGQVEKAEGQVTVQRADGTILDLSVGVKIYQNDVIQTGDASSLSVTFVDGTIFTLSAGSRMVIDELIYDPGGSTNSGTFNLIQGGFVFIAGQVAKTGGMEVNTPSATMGIRGTSVLVAIETRDGQIISEVSLTRDPDGDVGEIVLRNINGEIVANITDIDSKWILTSLNGEVRQEARTLTDDAEDNLLIAEAILAYRTAFDRVADGDTFVSLDSASSSGVSNDPAASSSDDLELDSIDDAPGIDGDDGPNTDSDDQGGNLDEGNLIIDSFDPPQIRVAGLEDSDENQPILGVVDIEPEVGQTLSFALASQASNGRAQVNPDGTFSFVPNADFNGEDTFTYLVSDGRGLNEIGVITVRVLPVNDSPVARNGSATVAEDGSVAGMARASDIDGDPLTFSLGSGPANGSVVVRSDGSYTYRPAPDFNGTDSFTVMVTDPSSVTDTARITVTVASRNDAPVITSPAPRGTVVEDGTSVASGTLVATDVDANATLAWSGSAAGTYGSFAVTAAGDWQYTLTQSAVQSLRAGEVRTEVFTAIVTDNAGATAEVPVTLTIRGANDAVVVSSSTSAKTGTVIEDSATSVATGRLTATDVDGGGTATWSGNATGTYGTFAVTTAGVWTFTLSQSAAQSLAQGQQVTDVFTATVTDDGGATATEQVRVTITGSNDAPQITTATGQDKGTLTEGAETTSASGQLTAVDPDTGPQPVWSGSGAGTYGNFTISANGTWTYTIDNVKAEPLAAGAFATETFVATATDAFGLSQSQQVQITIAGTNDAPVVARGTVIEVLTNGSFSGTLMASDADSTGPLTFGAGPVGPAHGTLTVNPDGTYTYLPTTGYQGLDTFEFTVTDSGGASTTGSVTVEVESPGISGNPAAIVGISTAATASSPAGTVAFESFPTMPTSLNLAIALDRSGSIGTRGWSTQINSVATAIEDLAVQYTGSATSVDVEIITFATDFTTDGPFNLLDPALPALVRGLPYTGGLTDWGLALNAAEDFYDAQTSTLSNVLLFITDGNPTGGTWTTALNDLTDTVANGYSVTIEAYGIGRGIDLQTLSQLDASPTLLNTPADLVGGLANSSLVNPVLIDFELTLTADGIDRGVIADQTHPSIVQNGLKYDLPIAEVNGIETLLGDVNRFSATVRYDLDGNLNTAELVLFTSELLTPSTTAEVLVGLDDSDLLLGGNLGDDIQGAGGRDVLFGLGGDDTIDGGDGRDIVSGGAGDDTLIVSSLLDLTGEKIEGGVGTDTLQIDLGGDLTVDVLPALTLTGIEAIDMSNGLSNSLKLTLSDIVSLSDTSHSELETLLGQALGDSAVILGDAGDRLTLQRSGSGQFQASTAGTVTDGDGNDLVVYEYVQNGNVLATLGVDDDVIVDIPVA